MASSQALHPERILHTLRVRVSEGKNLKGMDRGGTSDPYVVVSGLGTGQEARTPTVWKDCNPFWGEDYTFRVSALAQNLQAIVYDANKHSRDRPIGKLVIPISSLRHAHKEGVPVRETWHPLMPAKATAADFVSGSIHLSMRLGRPTAEKPGRLFLSVFQAHGLASKDTNGLSDPYCVISCCGKEVRTATHPKTLNPDFDERHDFFIPPGTDLDDPGCALDLVMYDKDLIGSDFMGAIHVPLSLLNNGETLDHWFDLSPYKDGHSMTPEEATAHADDEHDLGSLRLKLDYTVEEIYSTAVYDGLAAHLVEDEDLAVVRALAAVIKNREELAKVVVRIFAAKQRAVWLLNELNTEEIEDTDLDQRGTLFRGNTIATKANDAYLKLTASSYLIDTLGDFVAEVYDSERCYEVDPTRVPEGANLDENWDNLIRLCDDLAHRIFASAVSCPDPLRVVYRNLQRRVKDRWPGDDGIRYTVVSGFIFLRFFCAATLGPKLFDLHDRHPHETASRTLTLVAKTLQNLANRVEFGGKEPFMERMNAFINENIRDMEIYLDRVSTFRGNPAGVEADFVAAVDYERECATLQRLMHENREALEAAQAESPHMELGAALEWLDAMELNAMERLMEMSGEFNAPVVIRIDNEGNRIREDDEDNEPVPETPKPRLIRRGSVQLAVVESTAAERQTSYEVTRKNRQRVVDLDGAIYNFPGGRLAVRNRYFVREDEFRVTRSDGNSEMLAVFLFTDLMVLGRSRGGNKFDYVLMVEGADIFVPKYTRLMRAQEAEATSFAVCNLDISDYFTINCTNHDEMISWCDDTAWVSFECRGRVPFPGEARRKASNIIGKPVKEYRITDGDANAKRERRLSIGGAGAFGGDASAASPRVAFDLGDTETLSDGGLATPFADVAATRVFGDEGEASEAESPVAPGGRPIPASAIPAAAAFPPARAVEMDDERREHLAREQKIATAAGLLSGWINTRLAHKHIFIDDHHEMWELFTDGTIFGALVEVCTGHRLDIDMYPYEKTVEMDNVETALRFLKSQGVDAFIEPSGGRWSKTTVDISKRMPLPILHTLNAIRKLDTFSTRHAEQRSYNPHAPAGGGADVVISGEHDGGHGDGGHGDGGNEATP